MPLETVKRLNQSDRKYSFYAFYLVNKILISSGDEYLLFTEFRSKTCHRWTWAILRGLS